MKRKMLCPFIITLIGAILMLVMLLLPYASANSEHKDYLIEYSDDMYVQEIGMTNSEAVNISLVEFVRIYSEAINEDMNKETSIVCIAIIAIFAVFALITIILTLLKKPIGIIISDLLALVIFSIIHFDFKDRGVITNRSYDLGITNYLTYIVGGVNDKVEHAKERANESRKNCGKAIDKLGKRKVAILDGSIKDFIKEFDKLNHVELSESCGLNELQKLVLDKKSFSDLRELQGVASSLAGGLASGAMAGALTAFGAYGVAGALATASTGTAIASLSGAAATNATLAFFGEGSLAAGGLGMAGGTAVLGGLVAGPALAVLGVIMDAKASKNLEAAYSNLAKANEFEEEMKTAVDLCNGIRRRSAMFNRFLIRIQTFFDPLVYEMSEIINQRGTDFRKFSDDEKKVVASAMSMAGAIKAVLDTPILDEDGNLTKESGVIIEGAQKKVEAIIA